MSMMTSSAMQDAVALREELAERNIFLSLTEGLDIISTEELTDAEHALLKRFMPELLSLLWAEALHQQTNPANQTDASLWIAPRKAPLAIATPWLLPHLDVIERAEAKALPNHSPFVHDNVMLDAREAVLDAARLIEAISRITRNRNPSPHLRTILRAQGELLRAVEAWCAYGDEQHHQTTELDIEHDVV